MPSSPSLLNPVPHPSVPKDKSTKPISGYPPDSPLLTTHCRSPTRKNVTRLRPRNQSVAPRGSAHDRSTKRNTAFSLSIGPKNDNQAAGGGGGSNFKKPGPSMANKNGGKKKTDSNNPKQSEPQPSNNSQKKDYTGEYANLNKPGTVHKPCNSYRGKSLSIASLNVCGIKLALKILTLYNMFQTSISCASKKQN